MSGTREAQTARLLCAAVQDSQIAASGIEVSLLNASLIYRLIYHGLRSIHRKNCAHDRPKPERCLSSLYSLFKKDGLLLKISWV
jgi:hypothetical protein